MGTNLKIVDDLSFMDKNHIRIGESLSLGFIEFVNVQTDVNRYKYSYHYQDSTEQLIFRYDMAPHHKEVRTFPHHKHTASGQVLESFAPELATVLEEIEQLLSWHW